MLSSITPLGERGRGNRWGLTVTAYLLGSVVGGTLMGAALGAVGAALHAIGLTTVALAAIAALLAIVALVFDLTAVLPRVRGLRMPRYRRQVNEDWMSTYRGTVYGFGWGVQLGAGLVTIVTSALVYLVFALCALSASVGWGAVIGAVFGLTRGLAVFAVAKVDTPDDLRAFHRWLHGAAPAGQIAATVGDGLVLVAAVLAVAGATS
jgi:MFS family permease